MDDEAESAESEGRNSGRSECHKTTVIILTTSLSRAHTRRLRPQDLPFYPPPPRPFLLHRNLFVRPITHHLALNAVLLTRAIETYKVHIIKLTRIEFKMVQLGWTSFTRGTQLTSPWSLAALAPLDWNSPVLQTHAHWVQESAKFFTVTFILNRTDWQRCGWVYLSSFSWHYISLSCCKMICLLIYFGPHCLWVPCLLANQLQAVPLQYKVVLKCK